MTNMLYNICFFKLPVCIVQFNYNSFCDSKLSQTQLLYRWHIIVVNVHYLDVLSMPLIYCGDGYVRRQNHLTKQAKYRCPIEVSKTLALILEKQPIHRRLKRYFRVANKLGFCQTLHKCSKTKASFGLRKCWLH